MKAVLFNRVSKRFVIHHERSRSFQDLFVNALRGTYGSREDFWALRDVSFEVENGETLGIIGRNGAGKSTVLKLIARIIEPTSGRVTAQGRVSALLELGAGFHPDLTGKENIYLNGSLLGLSKHEMDTKLDAIIEFAELERFIDTPVKHYSSGMYVRLGFAIAISVEPDVLLVDEVLAVGDQRFQRKCVDVFHRFKAEGRTILFVSHDLNAVRGFCDNGLLLRDGQVTSYGQVDQVVNEYIYGDSDFGIEQPRRDTQLAMIQDVRCLNRDGQEIGTFVSGESMQIEVAYSLMGQLEHPVVGVQLRDANGFYILGVSTLKDNFLLEERPGNNRVRLWLDALPVREGRVHVVVGIADLRSNDFVTLDHTADRHYSFEIFPASDAEGLLYTQHRWEQVPDS